MKHNVIPGDINSVNGLNQCTLNQSIEFFSYIHNSLDLD